MSSTIDERVVKMEFNNERFEKNVRTSMSTLDKLKNALDFSKTEKALSEFKNVSNNLNFSKLESNLELIASRFTTMGIVATRVIQNITDAMMGLAAKSLNFVKEGILTGGLNRAMGIENAHFMLQGLLKDEEKVQAVMDQARDSVDGTAYAYNSAAQAAAQLTSSGVEAGEQMTQALAGITGVAATANAEYERVSQIFTTVAGQGRLMGDQLLQFSSMGLNAAATLSQYFQEVKGQAGMTEATIREMVSKGQVDFQTFAEAMNWAFGDQAKKANETLNGVTANIRAALAKIGEGFYSPLITQNGPLVKMLNVVREKINDVKNNVSKIQEVVTGSIINYVEKLQEKISEINTKVATIRFSNQFVNSWNAIGNVAKYLSVYIKPIGSAFNKIFSSHLSEAISRIAWDFLKWSETLKPIEAQGRQVGKAFENIFTFAKNIGQGVLSIFEALLPIVTSLGQVFTQVFGPLPHLFLSITEILGPIGTKFKETAQNLSGFVASLFQLDSNRTNFFTILTSQLTWLKEDFGTLSTGISAVFSAIMSKINVSAEDVYGVLEKVAKFTETINRLFYDAVVFVNNLLLALADIISNGTGFGEVFSSLQKMMGAIGNVLLGFLGPLGGLFESIFNTISNNVNKVTGVLEVFKNVVKYVADGVTEFFNKTSGFSFSFDNILNLVQGGMVVKIFLMLLQALDRMVLSADDFTKAVQGWRGLFKTIPTRISTILTKVTTSLDVMQNTLKAKVLKDIAIAVGILAVSCLVLAQIPPDRIVTSLGAVVIMITQLIDAMAQISNMESGKGKRNMMAVTASLIGMSVAILLLSSAMSKMATLEPDQLIVGIIGLDLVLSELIRFAKFAQSSEKDLAKGAGTMIGMAISMVIFASAVKKLGELDLGTAVQGVAVLGVIMAEIAAFTKNSKLLTVSDGAAFVGIAISMVIFGKAIAQIGELPLYQAVQGVAVLGVIMAEIAAFTQWSKILTVSDAVAFVGIATSMVIFGNVVTQLGALPLDQALQGVGVLGVIISEIAMFANYTNGIDLVATAGALLVMSVAMKVFADVVNTLGSMNPLDAAQGLIVMAGALVIMAGACIVFGAIADVLAPTIPTMTALAAAMALFGLSIAGIGVGVLAISLAFESLVASIVALAAASPAILGAFVKNMEFLLSALLAFIPNVVSALVDAFGQLILGILSMKTQLMNAAKELITAFLNMIITVVPQAVKTGVIILKSLLKGLVTVIPDIVATAVLAGKSFLKGLQEVIPDLKDTAVTFIHALLEGFRETIDDLIQTGVELIQSFLEGVRQVIPDIMDTAATIIHSFLETVRGLIPDIVQTGFDILLGLMNGIRDNIYQLVTVASEIIVNFCNGLADNIQPIIDAGVNLLLAVIEGIMQEIPKIFDKGVEIVGEFVNGMADVGQKLWDAGANLIQGIIDGVSDAAHRLWDWGVTCAQNFLSGLTGKQGLDENSPSKKGVDIGKYAVQGLVQGVTSNLNLSKAAGEKLGKNLTSSIQTASDSGMGKVNKNFSKNIANLTKTAVDSYKEMKSDLNKVSKDVSKTVTNLSDAVSAYVKNNTNVATYAKDQISSFTKTFSKSAKKAGDVLESYSKKIYEQSDAYKETKANLKSYNKELTKEKKTLKSNKTELSKANKELKKAKKSGKESDIKSAQKAVDSAKKKVTDTQKTITATTKKISKETANMAKGPATALKALTKELKNAYKEMMKLSNLSFSRTLSGFAEFTASTNLVSETTKRIDAMNLSFGEATETVVNGVDNIASMFDIFGASIDTGISKFDKFEKQSTVSAKKLLKNFKSQLKAEQDFLDGIDKMREKGFDDTLVQELYKEGPSALGKIKGFIKMSTDQVAEYNSLMQRSAEYEAQTYSQNLSDQVQAVKDYNADIAKLKAKGYSDAVYNAISNADYSETNAKYVKTLLSANAEVVSQINQDWNSAILESASNSEVQEKIKNAATTAASTWKQAMKNELDAESVFNANLTKLASAGFSDEIISALRENGYSASKTIVDELLSAVGNSASIREYNDLFAKTLTKGQSPIDIWANNLKSQSSGLSSYNDAMNKIAKQFGKNSLIYKQLEEMGWQEGLEYAKAFVDANDAGKKQITDALEENRKLNAQEFTAELKQRRDNITKMQQQVVQMTQWGLTGTLGEEILEMAQNGEFDKIDYLMEMYPNKETFQQFQKEYNKDMGSSYQQAFASVMENSMAAVDSKIFVDSGKKMTNGLLQGVKDKDATKNLKNGVASVAKKAAKKVTKSTTKSSGVAMLKGISSGLKDKNETKTLNTTIEGVASNLLKKFKKKLGIKSPSKEFKKAGEFIMEGAEEGIDNNEDSLLNQMDNLVRQLLAIANGEVDLNPIITPHFDLTYATAEAQILNSMINDSASYEAGLANGTTGVAGATFIQNNYSPKALDRLEIYRQTNNQIAMATKRMGR